MTPEEKQANSVGPGGYKCRCCGPAPKERKKWRRRIRHKLIAIHRRMTRNAIREMHND